VWPSFKDEVGFADRMNSMPKYVVSKTLQTASWDNSTIVRGDVVDEIKRLKERPGRDILVAGSWQLVHTLAQHQLVDEYRLMVFPIVLGSGKRLFGEGLPSTSLKIVESRQTSAVLTLRLQPA